jgi:hypothetical protein
MTCPKPLVLTGKEFSDEVRTDITLGNVVPQVGSNLSFTDSTDPNVKYPGTVWINTATSSKTVGSTTYTFTNYIRAA